MGWVIAIAVAVVGAAVAGLANWLLERRRERDESTAALALLLRNLEEAQEGLGAALDPKVNWWWPAPEGPRITAWDEYRTALARRLDAATLSAIALSADRLRSLDSWAQLQRERQARIEQELFDWLKTIGEPSSTEEQERLDETVARIGPSYELGAAERQALSRAAADIKAALPGVRTPPSSWRHVRSWKVWTTAIVGFIAIAGVVFAVIASQPGFTAEGLATALGRQLDHPSLVSCGQVNDRGASWECTAAWTNSDRVCRHVAAAGSAGDRYAVLLAAADLPCPLKYAERFRVLKSAKEDCYMALKTGVEPPGGVASGASGTRRRSDDATLSEDGFSPTSPTGKDATLSGCVD